MRTGVSQSAAVGSLSIGRTAVAAIPVCCFLLALTTPCLAQEASSPSEQLQQAREHVARHEYDAATALCRSIIAGGSDSEPHARLLLADIHLRRGAWQGAADEAADLVRKFPMAEPAMSALTSILKAHIAGGNAAGAQAVVHALVYDVMLPAGRGADAVLELANIYLNMKDADRALATAFRVLRDYPTSKEVNRAASYIRSAYQQRGGLDLALVEMRKLMAENRSAWITSCAHYQVAWIYWQKGDRDRAIEEYRAIVRKYPDSPLAARVQRELGDIYYRQKKYAQGPSSIRRPSTSRRP